VEVERVGFISPATPSLQESVTSCSWRFAVVPAEGSQERGLGSVQSRIDDAMAAAVVMVTLERKGVSAEEDIRPAIIDLKLVGPSGTDPSHGLWLEAELAAQPRAVRPSAVVAALGPGLEERSVRRMHQWILRDGAREEPLAARDPGDATHATHALERAS
jgi:hypothetical protein